ncbi:regulator of MON1-CCZ1 complex [Exaiptasia diaphana]|uniref:Mic1 domain-containing protein n=1 Tax=Exaiptasia diaphana TaxID=2652724 RepID=A0A913YMA1_EXADI|nr:regulator of MON1-CCZ1 complex [Exaiptasia diaphana]
MSTHYVQLCTNPLRFVPVSKDNSVFFDEANKQVFAVNRLNNITHVVVKGPDSRTKILFDIPDAGHVHSIKFSYDQKILAIQRSPKTVDFINFADGIDSQQYHQACKAKSAHVIGFNWTNLNEIVFITNQGLEFFQVMPEKHSLKMIKNYNVQVNWFVFLPESAMLLLSSSGHGNIIHPYHFRAGSVMRLPKFEVDLSSASKAQKVSLLERDVTLANIYGQLYVVILRNQSRGVGGLPGAEIVLYQLQRDTPAKKTAVLQLNMNGRFAVNVVDNLVLVHHQASKTSMLFDIKLSGKFDGQVTFYQPVLAPLPIEQTVLEPGPEDTEMTSSAEKSKLTCEMYSQNWIVFQPNIIIDAKIGSLWEVILKLEPLVTMIQDKGLLIDFLLLRRDSNMVILAVFKQALIPGRQSNLTVIAKMFDKVNKIYRAALDNETAALQGTETGRQTPTKSHISPQTVVSQRDMYSHVLSMFVDNKDIKYKFMVAVLVEYIRSLNQFEIHPEHYLYELVINLLVENKCYYQLHQFLQYHVISDSKPLACLMLSLESTYPPAYQLALDMLKRLSTASEEIVEILLSKYQLLPALRYIRAIGAENSASPRKFLEAASSAKDTMLFYTVFKFFEQRNTRLRGSPEFATGERCDIYVKKFEELFGNNSDNLQKTLEFKLLLTDHSS